MKSLNKTAALLGAGLMSAATLFAPGAASAEDTYTVSADLLADYLAEGISEGAAECIIGEMSDYTEITEFDRANIDGAVSDYLDAINGDDADLDQLYWDCEDKYPL